MKQRTLVGIISILFALMLAACGQSGSGNSAASGPPAADTPEQLIELKKASMVRNGLVQITSATNDQSQPVGAYDGKDYNRYLSVWTDARNTETTGLDIYGAFVNALTNTIDAGSEFAIATATGNQLQPDVAFDSKNGRFLIAFTNTSSGSGQIWGQFVSTAGAKTGDAFLLSQDVGATNTYSIDTGCTSTTFIVNSSNTGVIPSPGSLSSNTFTIDPASADADVTLTIYDTLGHTATISVLVNTTPGGFYATPFWIRRVGTSDSFDGTTIYANSLIVNVASSNNIVIDHNTATADPDIVNASSFTVDPNTVGSSTSVTLTLTNATGFQNSTVVTVIPSSSASLWADPNYVKLVGKSTTSDADPSDDMTFTVHGAACTSSNPGTNTYGTYTITDETQSAESPSVVYNDVKDRFMVAWVDSTDRDRNYFYNRADYSDTVCSLNFGDAIINSPLPDSYDRNDFYQQYLDGTQADTLMVRYRDVTYADATNGDNNTSSDTDTSPVDSTVYNWGGAAFIDALTQDTACTSTAETLSVSAKIRVMKYESTPRITYNPYDGAAILLWSGKGRTVDFNVSWTRPFPCSGDCWFSKSGPTYTVSDEDADRKIYVRRKPFGVVDDLKLGNASASYNPTAATNIYRKQMLVAWESHDTDKNILAQLIDIESGQAYGAQITVSNKQSDQTLPEQYDQTSPRAGYDGVNERYMVVWEDARNTSVNMSNMNIYGQFIDPQGQLSGSNFPITVDSGNQMAPAISFGDNDRRRFLVAWKDGRLNSASDIYGQFWEFSVAPQLMITDDLDNPLYTQSIDFGSVRKGQSKVKSFRIKNRGNAQLGNIAITNSADVVVATTPDLTKPFNITTPLPTAVNPDLASYYEMSVQFSPPDNGSYTGDITIDSDGGKDKIYFSGYGVSPILSYSNTDDLSNFTASLGGSMEKKFTVSNVGNSSLTITSISVGEPFTISGVATPLTLDPGKSQDVTVKFTPTEGGTFSKNITIVSDDPGKQPSTTIPVEGEAGTTVDPDLLQITTASLSDGTAGTAYSATLEAGGGTVPYQWSITNGPADFTINADTGVITGTPTSAGTVFLIVQVQDVNGATASKTFSVTISAVASASTTEGGGGGGGCFIATAAYGSYLDPHVKVLRDFRDGYLMTNDAGRAFVGFYYRTSPPVAEFIAKHDSLRTLTRLALTPVIFAVRYPVGLAFVLLAGVIAVGGLRAKKDSNRRKI